jgi:hypothetical protein
MQTNIHSLTHSPSTTHQVGGYHIYLMHQIKHDPAHTVFGFGKRVRRAWVAKIMSTVKYSTI